MKLLNSSLVAVSATGMLLLTACGGSSTKAQPAGPTQSSVTASAAATDTTASEDSPSPSSTGSADASTVDVCALLSPADAAAVARAHSLNGAQTAATVYKLTATKQASVTAGNPSSSCKFFIDGQGAEGTVVILVSSAAHFEVYATGEDKVSGLGDEAYSDGDSTQVRVGSLMLSVSEDSFGNDLTVDLFRKMIPHLPAS